MVLAFAPIKITSAVFFCPLFLILAVQRCRSGREAFLSGLLSSFVIMVGGFYWVVYTIHLFGHMPWTVATLLYLLFCSLGALCFPVFTWALYRTHRALPHLQINPWWYALGIPALFTLCEFFVPKLFPWYIGHTFFEALWLNQIVELTGCSYLTFLVASWGGVGAAVFYRRLPDARRALVVPVALTTLAMAFSLWRLFGSQPPTQTKRVSLIQPNIGSLEKVSARQGLHGKVQYTIDQYTLLTEGALEQKPDWILWPETAMPFSLEDSDGYGLRIRNLVQKWGKPLISGGYARRREPPFTDFNSAFLLEPLGGEIKMSIYNKNILLAFGEYFPGGEWVPAVYNWFPEVSNFGRGKDQPIFILADGTRVGVTICYEAIVPPFFRKITRQGVQAVVNLTNDSWFGPTSEPFQHAALSVFRAIESRTPLIRSTNTGISFAVDRLGNRSVSTGVYVPGALTVDVPVPLEPSLTVYTLYGDWLIAVLAAVLALFWWRTRSVPVPV